MAIIPADNQYVKIYDQNGDVLNPQGEIKNQQLNEALAAGTVESILMKTGYSAQLSYHVVVKQDIDDFLRRGDIDGIINTASFDFGYWQDWNAGNKTFRLKQNKNSRSATAEDKPRNDKLTELGEVVADNWQGAVWIRRNWHRPQDVWQKLPQEEVGKIDAGSVNGWTMNMHVKKGDVLTKQEIKDMINGMFKYNQADGSLTITKL